MIKNRKAFITGIKSLKLSNNEKMFLKKPLGIFKTLEETIKWVDKTYEEYCNQNCEI